MGKKSIFLIYFIFSVISANCWAASRKGNEANQYCTGVIQAEGELNKWIKLALQSDSSIGCPSSSLDSPLSKLELLSQQGGECGEQAIGTLVGFYAIFSNHPNYSMCGLNRKAETLLAEGVEDGKICADQPTNKLDACFVQVNIATSKLKMRGEMKAAFELARKTANSNDVTGLSQFFIGMWYFFGEGTAKNIQLSIKWFKESLTRLDSKDLRIDALIGLANAYEELGDYKNAMLTAQQCAAMGDNSCEKGLIRLNKLVR